MILTGNGSKHSGGRVPEASAATLCRSSGPVATHGAEKRCRALTTTRTHRKKVSVLSGRFLTLRLECEAASERAARHAWS